MDINALKYFVVIAETKSYTEAAKHLFISQPALSKSMKKLETRLDVGTPLQEGNSIILTDCGNNLLQHAKRILNDYDSIYNTIKDVQSLEKELYLLASPLYLALLSLPCHFQVW